MLKKRAKPCRANEYLRRIYGNDQRPGPFHRLQAAQFVWPKGRNHLSPAELSILIHCHPSLITKALRASRLSGKKPTPSRWLIARQDWSNAFPGTLVQSRGCPPLPEGEEFLVNEVVRFLRSCGESEANPEHVGELVTAGMLKEVVGKQSQGIFISRASLRKYRKYLQKGVLTQLLP